MASLFDYITAAQSAGQKPSTGYSYRKTSSGKDVYTPVNANNRAQRLNINPGSMGGGRSNLDSQRGFSNQGMGIAGLNPSNRQPGLFGSSSVMPSNRQPGLFVGEQSVAPMDEDDKKAFAFQSQGLAKNFLEDGTRMLTDVGSALTPNVSLPGLAGLFPMLGSSISKNQRDHRYLDSVFGRASPEKNMAFFNKAMVDANTPSMYSDPTTMAMGDTSRGSSLGQAMKYLERAGISKQNMARFMDPNDKFYGSEAYLRSQAGASGAEDFDIGMSFIKNAKATANLARDVDAQRRAMMAADADLGGPLTPAGGPIPSSMAPPSYLPYDDPDMLNDLLPGEPGYGMNPDSPDAIPGGDMLPNEDFYNYPDEQFLPAPYSPPIDMYEGIYESPLTDLLYSEELMDATPNRPLHSRHEFLPRDTIAITGMGGGMNALPLLEEEDILVSPENQLPINRRLDLYN